MITLETIRELVSGFALVGDEKVYMSKLDTKKEESIGCYHLNRGDPYRPSLGESGTYDMASISFLVHWNHSPRQTEAAAQALYNRLKSVRDETVNNTRILFIIPFQNRPIDVDKDENGICEYVIEVAVYFEERSGI